ncbi:MAG: hypothetical protein EON50_11585 [Acidovorax sp.]|nr:MAG: hypothetical protein EON50_11585 [Acidovorax sp.]
MRNFRCVCASTAKAKNSWAGRTCSRSFRGSHWSAIGRSGCFGCAAWARAHASSRGATHYQVHRPDFTPTLRASALPGGLRRCGACQ